MIDNLIQFIARLLAGFYELPVVGGSYGEAIMLLTFFIMILVMPLTLRATRSTIKMTMVAPELKRIQKEFKDDKEQMNAEMMELYREHGINPVGGCLPILAQAPIFLVLFQVIRGITRRVKDAPFTDVVNKALETRGQQPLDPETFYPRYLNPESEMFQSLTRDTEMSFLGVFDLGAQPNEILADSIVKAIPYLLLIAFLVGTSWYQHKQIQARRQPTEGEENPVLAQQQAILKYLPFLTGVWSFFFPTGLSVYWATSNSFRIVQQAYITRTIYSKRDEMEASFKEKLDERQSTKPAAEPKKKPDKAQAPAAADPSPAGGDAGPPSKIEQRRQKELERRRAIDARTKSKQRRQTGSATSRTTPKGTKPQRRKKR